MNRGLSLYLDLVRFLAALAVVVTHLAYSDLSGGMIAYWRLLGNDAVMVFFVLSGFVVAYVADAREHRLSDYTTARLARLWSVAVPALAFTILLDHAGQTLDPVAYQDWWYQAEDPLWRIFRTLTFTGQLWFESVRPFSNGPFWSLGYEFWYYAVFAALAYFSGRARIALAALPALIAGPKIMVLFPIWWLGVWTYRRTKRGPLPAAQSARLFLGSLAAYGLFRWSGLPVMLRDATAEWLGPDGVATWLQFSDEFISAYIIGPLVVVHFLGAHGLAHQLEVRLAPAAKPIRWLAQSTFALYLLHYPLLRFVKALTGYDEHSPLQVACVLVTVTVLCVTIGPVIERTKSGWKALLQPARARAQPA